MVADWPQLGEGLFGLCERLILDELPSAVPMEVGPRSFCLTLTAESSLLNDGRRVLGSS